ncbi:MAG: hypothetical protein AAF531_17590 [Actinomycetota bacterium]
MVEAVRTTKSEPTGLMDRVSIGAVLDIVFPVVMVVVLLVSLTMTLNHASALRTWSADYDGAGRFLVESCTAQEAFGGGQWLCAGRFTTEGATQELRTTLASPIEARGATRPYVGQRLEVFHASGDRGIVYPLSYRLNEITRVYLALIPRLLVMVGALMWVVGWFLTRNVDPDDLVQRDTMRLPQRIGWQARAFNWFIAAGIVWAIGYLVSTRIIGSLGTF